jgi:hypothetical protein
MTMMLARYKGKKVKVHTGQRQTLGIKRNRACSALLSCSLALWSHFFLTQYEQI